ncbi:MAG: hypothetical protein ACE5JA_08325 [bacterium]
MSEQRHNEREEEKGDGYEEWWRQGRWHAVGWGLVFIWGALILLAETTNYAANFSWWDGWGVFFTGAGVIVLLGLLIPTHRFRWVCSLIFGSILLAIGLGGLVDWGWLWPLVLFVIGVIILKAAFVRRR